MTSISVAVKIWAKTVAMNAILWGIGAAFKGEITGAFASIAFLIGGFIVTLPLLMLVTPLVKVSTCLPYGIPAKTAWLTFCLTVLIIIIYAVASAIIDNSVFKEGSIINLLMASTLGGLLFAVLTTLKSLKKLYSGV